MSKIRPSTQLKQDGASDGQSWVWDDDNGIYVPAGGVIEAVNVVSASGSTLTLPDVFTATMHRVTLTANCALTFPTAAAGKAFSLALVQDGTGGRTVTWDSAAKWGGGTAPTLSTGASKVDLFGWACFDGTNWRNLGYVLDSR